MADIGKMIVGIANAVQPNPKAQEWSRLLNAAAIMLKMANEYVDVGQYDRARICEARAQSWLDQAEKLAAQCE